MNHLKETSPDFGPQDLTLAAGFWKAYHSARHSLAAAFKFAVKGNEVDTVCFTGHSLGGGLAQCAYIDLSVNRHLHLAETTRVECYPISAPPICLGAKTQHWISRNANAANVHHYYCPYDAVHACDLVLSGTATTGSTILGLRHPLTSPYHFGSQLALDSNAKFPNAHEPAEVWRAMWDDKPAPKGFWQQIDFDILNSKVASSSSKDPIDNTHILEAISNSFNAADFKERAEQWANGITGHGITNRSQNKDSAISSIKEVSREYFTHFDKGRVAERNKVIDNLNKNIANNSSDTAGCVYHTLLIGIGIQRVLRDYAGVQAPSVQSKPLRLNLPTRARSNSLPNIAVGNIKVARE